MTKKAALFERSLFAFYFCGLLRSALAAEEEEAAGGGEGQGAWGGDLAVAEVVEDRGLLGDGHAGDVGIGEQAHEAVVGGRVADGKGAIDELGAELGGA